MSVSPALLAALLLQAPAAEATAPSNSACGQAISHAEERACYENLSQAALAELRQAEMRFLEALAALDMEPVYKQRTKAHFLAASKQFAAFRSAQCEVAASLAAGGNGAGDMRLACMVELSRGQIAAIQAWAASLK